MGYATESTVWPSPQISFEIKQLLDKFFSLVDNKAGDSGQRLGTEVFTPDGKFFATSGNFQGSAGMSLENATLETNPPDHETWRLTTDRNCQIEVYSVENCFFPAA